MSVERPVLNSVWSYVGCRVFLARPVLVCVSCRVSGEFLLHAPLGNLCVPSASSFGGWGVSLTRHVLENVCLSSGGESI